MSVWVGWSAVCDCGISWLYSLTFESFELVMPNISSMYLLWASLSFLLTKCLDSIWACLSAVRMYCLYLLNKWSLLRMDLLMSCVIQGSDDFVVIIRWGTYCPIPLCRALLKFPQSELSNLPSQVDRKDFWNANIHVSLDLLSEPFVQIHGSLFLSWDLGLYEKLRYDSIMVRNARFHFNRFD